MKKYNFYNIVATGLLGVLLTACSSDAAPYGETIADDYKISVSGQDQHLTFDMERSATIHVNVNNMMNWSVASKPSWISVEYPGHESLVVNVTGDNPSKDKRTGTIVLGTNRFGHEASIVVEQAGGYINATDQVEFPAMSDTKSISVTSNVSWKITLADSTFLTAVNPKNGKPGTTTVTLTSKNNSKGYDVVEYLKIEPDPSDNVSSSVPVKSVQMTHEKVTVKTILDNSYLPQSGGTVNLTVESNSEWVIYGLENWLTVSPKTGTKNRNVTISAGRNTGVFRWCIFYVTSGSVVESVWICQEGMPTPEEEDNTTPRYSKNK